MIRVFIIVFFSILLCTMCNPRALDHNLKPSEDCLNEFRKVSLDLHNEYRKKHNASSLIHDLTIEQTAQQYANNLSVTNNFVHSENLENIGENLFAKYSTELFTEELCTSKCSFLS